MLTGPEIIKQLDIGNIQIDPLVESSIGPNSVDLTLSNLLLIYGDEDDIRRITRPQVNTVDGMEFATWSDSGIYRVLDMKKENKTSKIIIPESGLILKPGQFYLGATQEWTETRGFVPAIETRSSVARLSICAHLCAGFGDNGFRGVWVLEMVAFEAVKIYSGVRICQIFYSPLKGKESAYSGKYNNQNGPSPSQIWRDFQK